jgi:hypothetical protein
MTLQELIDAAQKAVRRGQDGNTPVVDSDMREVQSLVATINDDGNDVVVATSTPFELE